MVIREGFRKEKVMTKEEREVVVDSMRDITAGRSMDGLSKLGDLLNPGWRQAAIMDLLDPENKGAKPKKRRRNGGGKKLIAIPKAKIDGAVSGVGSDNLGA